MACVGTKASLFSTPQNPNFKPKTIHHLSSVSPSPLSFLNFSSSRISTKIKRLRFHHPPRCSIDGYYSYNNNVEDHHEEEPVVYPRPSEIPWSKELCNSVNLIGIVGTPVQIKHLNSGKVLAWTRLGVKKSASDTSWINLTFWNELAHVAFQHLEKGNRIYVSGRLVSDTVEGDDDKPQTYYKVVVQQLNLVEKSFPPVPLYEHESTSLTTGAGARVGNYAGKNAGSTQELWQAFFANPVDWWDNRKNKRNAKYPDFKHKHTGEALWVEAKYNPPWVKSQLAILDSRMESVNANKAGMPVGFISGDDLTFF